MREASPLARRCKRPGGSSDVRERRSSNPSDERLSPDVPSRANLSKLSHPGQAGIIFTASNLVKARKVFRRQRNKMQKPVDDMKDRCCDEQSSTFPGALLQRANSGEDGESTQRVISPLSETGRDPPHAPGCGVTPRHCRLQAPGPAGVRAARARGADATAQPGRKKASATSLRSLGIFKTKSGRDITQVVMDLMWLASERHGFTFMMAKEAVRDESLTPEDIVEVCHTLGLAGLDLVGAIAEKPAHSGAHTAAGEVASAKAHSANAQMSVRQTDAAQPVVRDTDATLLKRLEDVDEEMRQILSSFGFVAHEHIARAERLLAHPSAEMFEDVVADSRMRSRIQYLRMLPGLVKRTRALDQEAAATYMKCREASDQPGNQKPQAELVRLNRELHQTFSKFCYQPQMIRDLITIAQRIAGKCRTSQRVIEQAQRGGGSVCRMPLVDIERQSIETMEEDVRMPCEEFLRNCDRLNASAMRFQETRRELAHAHLSEVASIAQTYIESRASAARADS